MEKYKMFGFIRTIFFTAMAFFNCNALNVIPLKFVPRNNQSCKIRTKTIDINNNEPSFCPYITKVNKHSGGSNNINDPYGKFHVPDFIKNVNVKVSNLMSKTNEKRHVEWHETGKRKCRLNESVCNNKQSWNNEICSCECQ